jgi:hypothetical protein
MRKSAVKSEIGGSMPEMGSILTEYSLLKIYFLIFTKFCTKKDVGPYSVIPLFCEWG